MQRIVFLDRDTIAPDIRIRPFDFPHDYVDYPSTRPGEVVERLRGARVAIVNKVRMEAADLAQLPDLKLIAVAATGTDCVDKEACAARGIAVANIRGYAVNTVPEHVFALILALRRNLIGYRDAVLDGAWQRAGQFCFFSGAIRDLAGARIGIVGRGALGGRVAEIARAFGMDPVFAGRKGAAPGEGTLKWEEVLETSDVLTLHCPLTPQTRGLIDRDAFDRMARKPLLINTARGGLIVDADLERALDDGRLSGAGIDVADREPPAPDSILMRLAARRDVILTPHVGWASVEAQQALADQLVEVIEAFVAGVPRNLVGSDR